MIGSCLPLQTQRVEQAQIIEGGDLTKFGLFNAITRFSQDVGSYDRASALEQLGGEVITLPRGEWELIAA